MLAIFFFSSRRRHTSWPRDWSSDVCSSDLVLFPFNRAGWFARNIEHDPVNIIDFGGDPLGDTVQDVVWDSSKRCCHRVFGDYWAQHDRMSIGSSAVIDSYRAHIGYQNNRCLPDFRSEEHTS